MRLYNTLARRVEEITPREPGRFSMYVCGPTVQEAPHFGHARAEIVPDVLRRYLEWHDVEVSFVRNITDVDDKIIATANRLGRASAEVAETYTRIYETEMARLGVRPPTVAPRATGHILEMIELIEELIGRDAAYVADVRREYAHVPEADFRAGRAAVAIEDVVSRKWLATVLSVEETSTQVEVAFTRALAAEGLDDVIADRLDAPPDRADGSRTPVLLAWSDNGPQMTSADTRSFMALHLIAQHFGRPGTPADQGWIESLFGHTKTEAPYLTKITDPGVLWHELEARRAFYNHVRLHAGVGYVTPDDEHCGRGPAIRQARHDGLAHARQMRLQYHRNKQ
jgi:hypothetical protein